MRRRLLPLAGLLLAASAPAATIDDPGCGTLTLVPTPGTVVMRLPHTFVVAGSDTVWTRLGGWERARDYVLDAVRGELRLLREAVPGDTLWVRACWLLEPPPLERQLQSYRPAAPAAPDSGAAASPPSLPARPVTSRSTTEAPSGASLSINGNKTLAVDFGSSQDAFLRQSLDLAVSGSLAPGVQLTGVLSDRNTPLTAAGTTQDIQSLDRVLIELSAPSGSAALGDVPLTLQQGEFARLERRVQGVRGEWGVAGFRGTVAAANAQGEYHRLQFFGVEGRQGPYTLTDRSGGLGVSVVAGSEVVTVDGVRMNRGESADYSIDYERARITFSNRRPITAASRITVDYQFTLNRYRRNLALAGGRWQRGTAYAFTQTLTESDDRGRPLDLTLDAVDRLTLQLAGDSTTLAVGAAVVPGGGDYDTVRVDSARVAFAWAGADSGEFRVQFARVGEGLGDYADSAVVSGRTAYRYVGAGAGAWRVGRPLPLPETHQLWSVGGGGRWGPVSLELEGAGSRHDLNTFSSLDDRDNVGAAGRASARLEGRLPGAAGGEAGLALEARGVETRFEPFTRLERPFAHEDWGLPLDGDLEHARRIELSGFLRPRIGGELRASGGSLLAPLGFRSLRGAAEWTRDGRVSTRALWQRAAGERRGLRFEDGGRDRWLGELRVRSPWIEPGLRWEQDERRVPSDTGRVGDRFREAGLELASPRALPWRAVAGGSVRRDARADSAGFADRSEARTWRIGLETPSAAALGAAVQWQRRDVRPLGDPRRARSDLASVRLRGEDAGRGLKGNANLEVTNEGENRRERSLRFVGGGRGAYDAFGNFVGTGDYELLVIVTPTLDRFARAATSARAEWSFGASEAWHGSRIELDFESEARRRGDLRWSDPLLAPGAALEDAALSRGSVLQRFEADLAPGSPAAAARLRAERRVTADRAFENFAQTLDDRQLSARWRARPSSGWTAELEGRWRRQDVEQSLVGSAGFRRTLGERIGVGSVAWSPDARLRAVASAELTWSRPEGQEGFSRTVRVGPDLGVSLASRARAELGFRRAFFAGPPVVGLLPSADPAGAPRWEGTARLDVRVRESTTAGLTFVTREHPGRPVTTTGRAELRAFF